MAPQVNEIIAARDAIATFEDLRRAPLLWAASTWRIDRAGARSSACHAGGWCVLETTFHVAEERAVHVADASAVHVAPVPAGGADAHGGVLGGAFSEFEGALISHGLPYAGSENRRINRRAWRAQARTSRRVASRVPSSALATASSTARKVT